jgi:hypothetical protein
LIIPDERGRVLSTRILSADENGSKIESTIQTKGTLIDEEFTTILTVLSRRDLWGLSRLEGLGVCTTKTRDEIRWKGFGVGWSSGKGAGMVGRFTETWFTNSQKHVWLNKIIGVEEFEIDEDGNTFDKVWEWK